MPLQGFHLLTLAVNIPGPVAAARLAELGARVTKVEPPAGDPLSRMCPEWYAALTQGMRVMTLDLKADTGRAALHEQLATADVLLTSSRPAALRRLGLDWKDLHDQHPRLCQVAIIGFAAPNEDEAGHDLTYQAALGTLNPPALPKVLLADMAGAERAVSAVLALLLRRERSGESGLASIALEEAAAGFAVSLQRGLTSDGGVLGGGLPGYRVYPTAEGWLVVAALEQHFLDRLLVELGIEHPSEAAFSAAFLQKPAAYWEEWARVRDLPLARVCE